MKTRDPLIIHLPEVDGVQEGERLQKTDVLMRGLEAIKGQCYRPSLLSMSWIARGNINTLLCPIKESIQNKIHGTMRYDHRELFELSDGGKIYIEYKGKLFEKKEGEGKDGEGDD